MAEPTVAEIVEGNEDKGHFFRDEGRYRVIEGADVEEGNFLVDTRVAEQFGGIMKWESLLRLKPDDAVLDEEDPSVPMMYQPQGKVFILWKEEQDVDGSHAQRIHEKIVELAKRNTPSSEFESKIEEAVGEEEEMIENPPKSLPRP